MRIYVAGMHRSGTSALARVVGILAGYDAPRRAAADNVAGHWEVGRINFELERILRLLGGDWASPPDSPILWSDPRIAPLRHRLSDALTALGDEPWVLKDPRLCLALQAVADLSCAQPLIVATYREPIEVAKSLQTRDGYPFEYGLALWEHYNRELLNQVQGFEARTVWLSYDKLMSNPRQVIDRLASHLSDHDVPVAGRQEAALATIDASLHHQSSQLSEDALEEYGLSRQQRELLDSLRIAGVSGRTPRSELPPVTGWATALLETRRPYARLEQDNKLLRKRIGPLRHAYRAYDAIRSALNRPVPPDPFHSR